MVECITSAAGFLAVVAAPKNATSGNGGDRLGNLYDSRPSERLSYLEKGDQRDRNSSFTRRRSWANLKKNL